jgi:hypothetical protein
VTTLEPAAAPEGRAEERQARLASAVANIRRSSGFDVERAMHWAGSILFPTGLIFILLGWYGAAHTSYDFEQIPYLISGGLFGAALTIVGGFLYFGYRLGLLVREGQRERSELVALLSRLDDRLATLEGVATAGLSPTSRAGGNGRVALVATPTGSLVHRPSCPLVAGKAGLHSVDPDEPGLKGCKVCDPFADAEPIGEPPGAGGSGAGSPGAGSAGAGSAGAAPVGAAPTGETVRRPRPLRA